MDFRLGTNLSAGSYFKYTARIIRVWNKLEIIKKFEEKLK